MIYSESTAAHTAGLLLQIKAINLNLTNPYKWASGWYSPIYTDNRVCLSFPEVRTYLKEQFADILKNKFNSCEMIAGVATAGIAHGALVADALNMPFCYVRSSPKSHGMTNLIEGKILAGQKVVVIEDLISTGGSSLSAVKALEESGCDVLGLTAIFSYGFEIAERNFQQAGCTFYTLTDYNYVIERAAQSGYVNKDAMESLQMWRKQPDTWHQNA